MVVAYPNLSLFPRVLDNRVFLLRWKACFDCRRQGIAVESSRSIPCLPSSVPAGRSQQNHVLDTLASRPCPAVVSRNGSLAGERLIHIRCEIDMQCLQCTELLVPPCHLKA